MTEFDYYNTSREREATRQRSRYFAAVLILSTINLVASFLFINPLFILIFIAQIFMVVTANSASANSGYGSGKRIAIADVVITIVLTFGLVMANLIQPRGELHAEFLVLGGLSFFRLFTAVLFARVV